MSVDLKKIKAGDTVVYQNGNMYTVTYIRELDNPIRDLSFLYFFVNTYNETLEGHRARTHNEVGHVVVDGEIDRSFSAPQADEWDIVKHIPAESSEETRIDATKIEVGDKIRLRNGDVHTVTEVYLTSWTLCSMFPVHVHWLGDGSSYTTDGFYRSGHNEDPRDIVEIIPAESSEEEPSKDEMTLRDQFAMAALGALLQGVETKAAEESVAKDAYFFADEMMKARKGIDE